MDFRSCCGTDCRQRSMPRMTGPNTVGVDPRNAGVIDRGFLEFVQETSNSACGTFLTARD